MRVEFEQPIARSLHRREHGRDLAAHGLGLAAAHGLCRPLERETPARDAAADRRDAARTSGSGAAACPRSPPSSVGSAPPRRPNRPTDGSTELAQREKSVCELAVSPRSSATVPRRRAGLNAISRQRGAAPCRRRRRADRRVRSLRSRHRSEAAAQFEYADQHVESRVEAVLARLRTQTRARDSAAARSPRRKSSLAAVERDRMQQRMRAPLLSAKVAGCSRYWRYAAKSPSRWNWPATHGAALRTQWPDDRWHGLR